MQHKQRGGTFLGIILGVVLGLGAALGVAVYVTKVPVPFLNRNASRSADQDAIEAQKNRDWDPNSGIAGKRAKPPATAAAPAPAAAGVTAPQTAAVPAAPVPVPDPATPAAPATRTATAPAAAPARAAAAPSSSDPLGDLARARSAAAAASPAVPPPGNAEPYEYFIQAGAFRTDADAEAQRARLAIMGWEARVTEREQAGRTVFRVRVGPFVRRDDAERLKDKLDVAGMDSTLVRVQR